MKEKISELRGLVNGFIIAGKNKKGQLDPRLILIVIIFVLIYLYIKSAG